MTQSNEIKQTQVEKKKLTLSAATQVRGGVRVSTRVKAGAETEHDKHVFWERPGRRDPSGGFGSEGSWPADAGGLE